MNEVVKYHNDLNNISLNSLTENQINILFTIFAKIENKDTKTIKFPISQIIEISGISTTNKEYLEKTIFNQFDKLQTLKIKYSNDDGTAQEVIFPRVHIDKKREFLSVKVSEAFAYIFNNLVSNFTRFELAEFVNLSGKYTKTIYRLLKQFRSTGYFKIEFERFKEILDIPKSYKRMSDIESDIIKPAIKELTAERNLFDQARIPFRKLNYEKGKTKGKGNKITHLIFTFTPENTDNKEQKAIKKDLKAIEQRREQKAYLEQFYNKKVEDLQGTLYILFSIVEEKENKITLNAHRYNKELHIDDQQCQVYFKSIEEIKEKIKEYEEKHKDTSKFRSDVAELFKNLNKKVN